MPDTHFPPQFLQLLEQVRGKRSRVVIDHILKHGFITTDELENTYGYNHPPRAVRDVHEQGVPIETFHVKNEQGRTIAAYRFGDVSQVNYNRLGGRKVFSKTLKSSIYKLQNGKCAICQTVYDERYLQIDHRIPYLVSGEPSVSDSNDLQAFMLLCSSCNRAKSWSCKHCENGITHKNPATCLTCYWFNPFDYEHIAMWALRRLDIEWSGDEIAIYDALQALAKMIQLDLPDYVKYVLHKYIESLKDN